MPKNTSFVESIYALHNSIKGYVSRIVPPSEVEDIVQDIYVRLCSLEDQKAENYNRSFVYTIARNLSLDHLKRADVKLTDKVGEEIETFIDDADSTYDLSVTHERFGHFCEIVRAMPKQCRKVFVLRKVYGFSQKEIAQKLNISVSTVSNHLVVGMKQFKSLSQQVEVQPSSLSQQITK
ncbi:RNA polymerase sigma factor [Alteromonadaceae bacterium BrNp21-10]|nr:RNA polymerase sigma factor [Alteromonadaceae bacterium BrNp21-10]